MNERFWQAHYDYNVPTTIRYPRIALPELLQIPANTLPDKQAINYEGAAITFQAYRRTILRMANALAAMGVEKGDRVGIQLPNCPQFLIAYYAALSLGAVVVNLNPAYALEELTKIASDTGLCTLFTLDETAPRIRDLCSRVPIPHVILTGRYEFAKRKAAVSTNSARLDWHLFASLLEGGDDERRPRIEVDTEDPAVIQFTGGTTGIPKGAVLTHANILAAVMQTSPRMFPIMQFIPPERRTALIIIPLYHVYGNLIANWSLFNAVTLILVPRFDPDEVIDLLLEVEEVTYFPAVPTMLTALINHPRIGEIDLGRKIHVVNSGAAPCPVELLERLRDMGVFITEAWGMTETASMGAFNPILGKKKPGSIGVPAPDNDIRIVDTVDGTTEVPRGQPGELLIKGPSVMKGYWNNPEETARQLVDGWLHTGDIVVQDEDGFLFIVDRKKDMIIAGGFNIYPREVDEVLYSHPKVKDAVTVGIPDAYRGETVQAFIVPKEGQTISAEEIIAFCKEKMAPYKVPRQIEFRDALPQSTAGKILRRVLRDEALNKHGQD
ncbi:long-chain-fatty-acid--CoA ligase [Desulfatitalea alkaliphila]|uniref:Long-chain fatty acid--CoA ligase n=1 Tax=Desulfatitalea alkaliphila TaxID=2929485 RepID=A0AA41R4G4_9BACT|nr:long-chain fatty acid--CoA ligase [Desulfatitalea alkaliphila]MCJ8500705.1 long-chain fatty acid--CoA ligase [Desulfatitalea alkaliphila]